MMETCGRKSAALHSVDEDSSQISINGGVVAECSKGNSFPFLSTREFAFPRDTQTVVSNADPVGGLRVVEGTWENRQKELGWGG